jgi:probable rRNA maturation factor
MNRIEISAEEVPLPPWTAWAAEYARRVLEALGRDGWDLSVLFCGNAFIRSLNARYRGRDEATDVLSFALGETVKDPAGDRYLSGDIVISLETLAENAAYFKVPREEELRRLLVHGVLHLDGMDHRDVLEGEPGSSMLRLQERLLAEIPAEIPAEVSAEIPAAAPLDGRG